jgi:hypothetical protein
MINVNQITSELARMPDAALKQYATMHKNDPYTMSLAMSESNRRKQMRESAQAQGGQQPTVVDQELSQMDAPQPPMPEGQAQGMPEDSGIAMLPQQPMSMAEGGIVAFKDEGAVVDPNMSVLDKLMGANEKWRANTGNSLSEAGRESQREQVRSMLGLTPAPAVSDVYPDESLRAGAGVVPTAPIAPVAPPAPPIAPPAPPIAPEVKDKGGIPRLLSPAAAQQNAMSQYKDIRGQLGGASDADIAAQTKLLGQEGIKAKTEALTAIEADNAKFADILKGKESGLTDRAAAILKQSDTNTGMAFLNAGLAIMSTPGSLATAIGKGALVGTASFTAGMDKINAAKDKLAEAQDRLEDLKINRAEMSAKDIRSAKAGINDAKVTALSLTVQGLKDAGAKSDKAAADILHNSVSLQTNAADNATRMAAAKVAARPSGIEGLALALGKGDVEAGFKKYTEMTGEGKGIQGLITGYAKDPIALKMLETTDPAMAEMVKQRMQGMLVQAQSKPTGQALP